MIQEWHKRVDALLGIGKGGRWRHAAPTPPAKINSALRTWRVKCPTPLGSLYLFWAAPPK
jgi:hypothetical protein